MQNLPRLAFGIPTRRKSRRMGSLRSCLRKRGAAPVKWSRMIFATYSTFQQMHGRKSSLQELVDRLRPCSRDSVVSLCSFICVLLKLWDADPFDLSRYDHLI